MNHELEIYIELYKRRQWDKIPIVKLGTDEYGYLTDKQLYAMELLTDNHTTYVGYGGSARSGKTILEAYWISLQLLAYPETRYCVGRDELKRIRMKTIKTFVALWTFWGMIPGQDFTFDNQDQQYKFSNGSELPLVETKYYPRDEDYLRFGGMELTGACVDESNESQQKAINTLFTRIGWQKNHDYGIPRKMLETFNPNKSHVYSRYYIPYKNKEQPEDKKFIPALPGDNPHPSVRQWMDDVIAMGDKNLIERLIHGNFEYDDDQSSLVDYDSICDLFTNDHVKETGEKYLSADLALQGRDRFIIAGWNGLRCKIEVDKKKSSAKEIEGDIKYLKTANQIPNSHIIADSDGIGAFIESYVDHIKTFHAVSNANDKDTYKTIKDELAYKLAELITRREIYITCTSEQKEQIKTELLTCLKADDIDNDGKKRIISKKIQKEKLGGKSPDYFDTLMMGMYFHVNKTEWVF